MVAYQPYRIEIDLKPIDEECGIPVEGLIARPVVHSHIPWSYNRNQIPDLFARKGVSLDAWERAVDSAEPLFKDRNTALERAKRPWLVCVLITLYIHFLIIGLWTFRLYQTSGDIGVANYYILYQFYLAFFCFFTFFLRSMANTRLPIILDRVSSQFEEQWSHQVGNLNAIYQEYGITVKASTRNVKVQGHDFPWSVGFVFTFKIHPSNEEEAARFLAYTQTSGVSDATFQRRTMRMVSEQLLMHVKPEAIGHTAALGGDFAMALAVVVDSGDDYGNTEGFSEKSTLLDVV
jgi:hypothetical protein